MADSFKQFVLRVISGEDLSLRGAVTRGVAGCIEPVYSAGMRLRNSCYDRGIFNTHDLGRPAISVGNITTGGTGKTPVVQWLAEQLRSRGKHPAILLRGYGGKAGASDEGDLLREALNIPVQACPSRIDGGATVLREHPDVDLFLLDDAFQHRRVKRNFNLVLISATNPFGFRHVLPRGLLREPLSGLNRADAFLITRCSLVPAEALARVDCFLNDHHPTKPVYHCDHQLTGLWSPLKGDTFPMDTLAGQKVFLTAGIGDPIAFSKQLTSFGCTVVGTRWFDDHHAFSTGEIASLFVAAKKMGADRLITTEKDWVKLKTHWAADAPIWVAKLAVEFRGEDGHALLSQMGKSI